MTLRGGTSPKSLAGALAGHDNALGLLRLFFASLVIFDHAFPIGGFGADPFWALTRGQASLGSIAVMGFFSISGYLITKSGMTSDILQFSWRRVLRIFPAYWVLLAVTAFVVGPALWLAEGREFAAYFERVSNSPYHFLAANWHLDIGTYGIRDLLASTTPYGREVGSSVLNGSIWTLSYEWLCYVVIGVLLVLGVLRGARLVVPALTLFFLAVNIGFALRPAGMAQRLPFLADTQVQVLVYAFLVGASLAVFSRRIPMNNALGITAIVGLGATLAFGGWTFIGIPALAFATFYLGSVIKGRVGRIGQVNDYSYGVYVYGFLVQQVLAYVGLYRVGYFPFVLVSLIVTLGCGWLSWHGVEKWAMRCKDWGPGLGVHVWRDRIFRGRGGNQSDKQEVEGEPLRTHL